MFILKQLYCRIFQGVFKIALPFLPYRKPDIIEGILDIPNVLKKENSSSVLLITDSGIRNLGLTRELEENLVKEGFSLTVYDKTVPNPTTDNIEEALAMYKTNNCDSIIGFGGGSSMDCAKGLGVKVACPNKSLRKMKGILKVRKKLPLLIAVPTTAGTGSETTLAAVITDSKTRHKYAINDFPLIPRYAVLEPKITLSLPKQITATTGMDALTHAIEAYIGNSTTYDTRMDALLAIRLIFDNIHKVYQDGTQIEPRRDMLKAAFYAGCAFTKSYVGYVHAIAHSLGGKYNTPHGLANAVLLPFVLEAYGKKARNKLAKLAYHVGIVPKDVSKKEAAQAFIEQIKEMKHRLGIGDTIEGIREEDIPLLAKYADKEANPLYPVPKLMDARQLEKFYYMLMGKNIDSKT